MNEIKIILDSVKSSKLSVSNYIFLYCLCKNIDSSNLFMVGEIDYDLLEDEGYIKEGESFVYFPRNKAFKLFNIDTNSDSKWLSFKSVFPIKDNKRRLHDQQEACKEKFNKLINNNPEEFDKIMLGLTNELEARRISGVKREFFPAPKAMSVWLNQKHYLTYQDKIENEETEEKVEGI